METATSQCDAIAVGKRGQRSELRDCFFKCYVVVLAVFVWTGYTLLVAYTRQKTPKSELYSSSTVVFFSECTKLAITLFFIYRDCDFSITAGKKLLDREYFSKPLELLKMSVPSIAYALQNNLDFVALSNLEASVYQVTTQLKIPSTAVFMMLFLGRRFSMKRWVAILLLCAGVASVELDSLESEGQIGTKSGAGNRFVGIFAVFATCVTAGFAGVYFEKMLKDGSSTPFWIRNLQMYSCGVFSAFVGCFLKDYGHIRENGLFYGYNVWVLAIVLSLSLGGIYISLIMKHLDNLYKSFASSISIVAVTLLSLLLFENTFIGTFFLFGALTVCFALVLYNSVDQ
uniref:CMP-sialic acid transporter n=1 Tax=Globodera rostochiensis TaxID=31243 RepID=A0A914GWB0_GLORO